MPGMQRMDRLLQPMAFGQMQAAAQALTAANNRRQQAFGIQAEQQTQAQVLESAIAVVANTPPPAPIMLQALIEPEPAGVPGMRPVDQPSVQAQGMQQPFGSGAPPPFAPFNSGQSTLEQVPTAQLQSFLEAAPPAPTSWGAPSLLGLLGAQPVFAAPTDPPRNSPWMVVPDVGGSVSLSAGIVPPPLSQESASFGGGSLQAPQSFGFSGLSTQEGLSMSSQTLGSGMDTLGGQPRAGPLDASLPASGPGCVLCQTQTAGSQGNRWKNYFSRHGDSARDERLRGEDGE